MLTPKIMNRFLSTESIQTMCTSIGLDYVKDVPSAEEKENFESSLGNINMMQGGTNPIKEAIDKPNSGGGT
jgi:hypothetical protein